MKKVPVVMLLCSALALAACGSGDDEVANAPVATPAPPAASPAPGGATFTPSGVNLSPFEPVQTAAPAATYVGRRISEVMTLRTLPVGASQPATVPAVGDVLKAGVGSQPQLFALQMLAAGQYSATTGQMVAGSTAGSDVPALSLRVGAAHDAAQGSLTLARNMMVQMGSTSLTFRADSDIQLQGSLSYTSGTALQTWRDAGGGNGTVVLMPRTGSDGQMQMCWLAKWSGLDRSVCFDWSFEDDLNQEPVYGGFQIEDASAGGAARVWQLVNGTN